LSWLETFSFKLVCEKQFYLSHAAITNAISPSRSMSIVNHRHAAPSTRPLPLGGFYSSRSTFLPTSSLRKIRCVDCLVTIIRGGGGGLKEEHTAGWGRRTQVEEQQQLGGGSVEEEEQGWERRPWRIRSSSVDAPSMRRLGEAASRLGVAHQEVSICRHAERERGRKREESLCDGEWIAWGETQWFRRVVTWVHW
jgi:hypothetical protein